VIALISGDILNQSGSDVSGHQVGGNLDQSTTNNYFGNTRPTGISSSQVQTLLQKLVKEKQEVGNFGGVFIEQLEYYVNDRSSQTTMGLEAKLKKVGRETEVGDAIRKKEAFAKMLLKFQHWEAAQQLFAYFLALIESAFSRRIIPCCDSLTRIQIEEIIGVHIVDQIKNELGAGDEDIIINDSYIQGMIFWLADKCYVRWHQ
jgi:hypothetical protein